MIRPCPDHPRSRGVYSCPPSPRASTDGSSPLARGLPPDSFPSPSTPRIIPARAGFTRPAPPPSTTCGDHPRSRGVYGVCAASRAPSSGSSPLARGLQGAVVDSSPAHGIIPARAGFTRRQARRGGHHGDHPRSRGVYTIDGWRRHVREGSSPLARGLQGPGAPQGHRRGIIPARAGFTPSTAGDGTFVRDHPRSRGVYSSVRGPVSTSPGSSPLARGLRGDRGRVAGAPRIIPARAGFTWSSSPSPSAPSDHPRSRGVYPSSAEVKTSACGSSPLARGLRHRDHRAPGLPGIIPARAGFTGRGGPPTGRTRDHPRSRGVYDRMMIHAPDIGGSSPLARGLLAQATQASAEILDHPRSRGVYPVPCTS